MIIYRSFAANIFYLYLRKMLTLSFLIIILTICSNPLVAQIPVDLSGFNKKSEAEVSLNKDVLDINWPVGNGQKGNIAIDLQQQNLLIRHLRMTENGTFKVIAKDLQPSFFITEGKRDLKKRSGWTIFFDNPSHLPHETHVLEINKKSASVSSEGSRTYIKIDGATAGFFSGSVQMTLFHGDPLIKMEAVLSTDKDSVAFLYDAGLTGNTLPWEKIWWSDTEGYLQSKKAEEVEAEPLAVKYRAIIGQSENGSLAIFPPPHQYFYPLDNAYNLKHVWSGENYGGSEKGFGIGIRHELLGDRRWVPWFNAPPATQQHLSFFCLLSTEKDGKALENVKQYTNADKYRSLPGYYTMASHFHTEHTDDVLTHKPLPEVPGYVKAFRNSGVNIVHLGEFHGRGSPRGPAVKRLSELKVLFDESARLSSGDFLLLPGEEPNNFYGGHWMNIFPHPVYWVMSRQNDEPFVEQHPEYGKVYRIGNKEEMLKLLELENGLAWTAHARIKGSTGFPDKHKDEDFFKSDHFLGAAWKAMPADLSQDKLGTRVLDLMDDMANWGHKKYVIGEADLFKIEPDYELYGHMNINYLRMDELPEFEESWQPVLDALQNGNFFVTTGEVLIPEFSVNGTNPGETAQIASNGRADINVEFSWTFPLKRAEIISGDGDKVYREVISLSETDSFGSKDLQIKTNLKNRKWVRLEIWDEAANGAFTQIVWLNNN